MPFAAGPSLWLTAMPGGPWPPISLPSLPTTKVPKLVIRAVGAGGAGHRRRASSTSEAGTVRVPCDTGPPPPALSSPEPGRTMTSPTAPLVSPVNARSRVSVKM